MTNATHCQYTHRTGMLSVAYPSTWTVREYPDDPRAKVEFADATRAAVARLIARPTFGEPLEEMLPDFEDVRLRMAAQGVKVTVSPVVTRGVRGFKQTMSAPGTMSVLYAFVDADMYCVFSFESTPPDRLSRNWPTFEEILLGANLQAPATVSEEQGAALGVASRIRLAELGLRHGNVAEALRAVKEGLETDPYNPRLHELREKAIGAERAGIGSNERSARVMQLHQLWIRAQATAPLIALFALDLTGRLHGLAPLLVAFPFLEMRRQIHIWFVHLRVFGKPSLGSLQTMLKLDAVRGYDARSSRIQQERRGPLWHGVVFLLGSAGTAAAVASLLRWWSPLYLTSRWTMLATKGLIRRMRPPSILLLGVSRPEFTVLHHGINEAAKPLEATTLARNAPLSAVVDFRLAFLNFRTASDSDWRAAVAALVPISGLVVLDLRESSDALVLERDLCLRLTNPERLFVLTNEKHGDFPASRCFSLSELLPAISQSLGRAKPPE